MSTELTTMQQMVEMAKGLQQSAQEAAEDTAGFMKFTKFGNWIFGAEENEVEEESLWAIHPQGFQHGFIAWGDKDHNNPGEKVGEVMVPATQPMPLKSELEDVEGVWAQQVSMQMLCIKGFDAGTAVVYNANSVGGRKAYKKIVTAVVNKIAHESAEFVPVVKLENESYTHKTYGKIFNPIVSIVDFETLGELEDLARTLVPEGEEDDSPDPVPEKQVEKKEEPEVKKEEPKKETKESPTPSRKRRERRPR